jgi:NAD(P)H-flavin reductase
MIAPAVDPIADPMLPRAYQVQRVRRELHDTWTLALAQANEHAPPPFAPGQFNMLYVFGVGEIPISISGDPARDGALVHTVRAVGPVSQAICALKPQETVGVRGPFGSAWPLGACEGKDVLVIGGGIGLAPLRPVVYQILAERERYGRVALLYGARTPIDLLYRTELERWRAHGAIDVLITVDRGTPDWSGSVGVVTKLIDRVTFEAANAVALVCGPEIMMRFSAAGVLKQGIAADRVFVSMERDMQCGVGLCGHCQYGPVLVCRDGPVFRYDCLANLLPRREI